jgi:hypothetical protein
MKKIIKKMFVILFIIFLNVNVLEAKNVYEKELPSNFKSECFEFTGNYHFSSRNEGKYKIKMDKQGTVAVK